MPVVCGYCNGRMALDGRVLVHAETGDVTCRAKLAHWARRLEALERAGVLCHECGTDRVELVDYYVSPARYRCRLCKCKFEFDFYPETGTSTQRRATK